MNALTVLFALTTGLFAGVIVGWVACSKVWAKNMKRLGERAEEQRRQAIMGDHR